MAPMLTAVAPMLRARDSFARSIGSAEITLAIAPYGMLVPV